MDKDTALRLALEFVEANHSGGPDAFELIDIIKASLEAKDEPIATKNNDGVTLHLGWDDLPVGTKLYATPPQRKPLTDEQIGDEFVRFQVGGMFTPFLYAVRAIEAAHGIKGEK